MLKYFNDNLKMFHFLYKNVSMKMLKYFTDCSLICNMSCIDLKNYIKIFQNFFKTVYKTFKICYNIFIEDLTIG